MGLHCFLLLSVLAFVSSRPLSDDEYAGVYNPMENPGLFEGDILEDFDLKDRNAVVEAYRKWPNGRIPYVIDESLKAVIPNIKIAMDHIELKTCIKFVPKTDDDNKVYLKIFKGRGCYSKVGKTIGEQPLSLGAGCHSHGAIVHELGHAIGFYHEHSRSDRDDYIIVHWENIRKGYEDQFEKLRKKQNVLYDEFDYDSIMLYGETIFSKDHAAGLKTMTAKKEGITLKEPYSKPGLSKSDVFRINKMYQCPEKSLLFY